MTIGQAISYVEPMCDPIALLNNDADVSACGGQPRECVAGSNGNKGQRGYVRLQVDSGGYVNAMEEPTPQEEIRKIRGTVELLPVHSIASLRLHGCDRRLDRTLIE